MSNDNETNPSAPKFVRPTVTDWDDMAKAGRFFADKSRSDVYDRIDVLLVLAVITFVFCMPAIIYMAYHLAAKV